MPKIVATTFCLQRLRAAHAPCSDQYVLPRAAHILCSDKLCHEHAKLCSLVSQICLGYLFATFLADTYHIPIVRSWGRWWCFTHAHWQILFGSMGELVLGCIVCRHNEQKLILKYFLSFKLTLKGEFRWTFTTHTSNWWEINKNIWLSGGNFMNS